jgi:hypothetical protein
MGELAAETLLRRINGGSYPRIIAVEPELVVRESTAPTVSSNDATRDELKALGIRE